MVFRAFCAAWLVGIVAASRIAPTGTGTGAAARLAAGAAIGLVAALVLGRRLPRRVGLLLGLTVVAALGAARQAASSPDLGTDHVALWNDRGRQTLRGRIAAEPDRRDWGVQYRVEVSHIRREGDWAHATGVVLAQAPRFPLHAYGEDVLVEGPLETPPTFETFDYRTWLAQRGVHSVMRRARITTVGCCTGNAVRFGLLAIKERARQALAGGVPAPESALATGIVLGDARGMPERLDEAFRATNTTHVIAISGSNVAFLTAALMAVGGRLLGRKRSVPAVLAVLGLYTALVGADAAVVRAALMAGCLLVGRYLGRPGDAANALGGAATAMTVFRPAYIADLGFQLSFAATLGLLWFAGPSARWVQGSLAGAAPGDRGRVAAEALCEAVLVTLAAQLTTWPIIAMATGQVSVAGLLANFLIVPAQGAVMALGCLTAVVGAVAAPAGRLAGSVAWVPLAYTIRVVEAASKLPLAQVPLRVGPVAAAAYYALLYAVAQRSVRRSAMAALASATEAARSAVRRPGPGEGGPRNPHGRLRCAALPAAACACALSWSSAAARPDGLLHVLALDIGQGDAILIVTPNGRRALVDGGPSPNAVLDALGRRFAPWDRRLDLVVLTHPDADHVGGLPAVLSRYEASWILEGPTTADSPDALAWRAAVADEGARRVEGRVGAAVVLDEDAGVRAEVLWPEEGAPDGESANDRSVVLRLTFGAATFLLTGDIEAGVEERILASGRDLRAEVLKVGHHGSETSSTPAFVGAVQPWLALISVGADNSFGHPSVDVLRRLDPAAVRRTDRHGTVEVVSDGEGIWVRP